MRQPCHVVQQCRATLRKEGCRLCWWQFDRRGSYWPSPGAGGAAGPPTGCPQCFAHSGHNPVSTPTFHSSRIRNTLGSWSTKQKRATLRGEEGCPGNGVQLVQTGNREVQPAGASWAVGRRGRPTAANVSRPGGTPGRGDGLERCCRGDQGRVERWKLMHARCQLPRGAGRPLAVWTASSSNVAV